MQNQKVLLEFLKTLYSNCSDNNSTFVMKLLKLDCPTMFIQHPIKQQFTSFLQDVINSVCEDLYCMTTDIIVSIARGQFVSMIMLLLGIASRK